MDEMTKKQLEKLAIAYWKEAVFKINLNMYTFDYYKRLNKTRRF